MTLYEKLTAEGIECDHWQSDLYFPFTAQTRAILAEYPKQVRSLFKCNVTGKPYFDCALAYDPYWVSRGF
jgi:hypothetical protein